MIEKEHAKHIVVIDTETTGLDPIVDELLQVAIISGNGDVLYNSYLRPVRKTVWPEAQRINGISPETVACAPAIPEELEKIQAILSDAKAVVGYNVSFDIQFLERAGCCVDHLFEEGHGWHFVDLMDLFAAVYGEWDPRYESYKWKKLTVAADYYGYDWGEDTAHDALSDCKATLHVWNEMVMKGDVLIAERRLAEAHG